MGCTTVPFETGFHTPVWCITILVHINNSTLD